MKKIILVTLAILPVAAVSAQEATPVLTSSPAPTVSNATPARAADVEALREQVQSLTETVKTLQQQVKDQQAALEKANLTGESGLPQNPEPSPIAAAENSPAPGASAPPRFPTEDTSVVSSTTAPPVSGTPAPGGFPTTDTSVVTSAAPETISSTGAGASFMQTTSLPYKLQLKAGQFFAAFGRLNPTHPHTWDFADTPLVNGLFLGPDGLRGVGAQTSWTLPLPWYSQLIFASQNGRGSTGFSFRNPGDDGMFFDRITTDREARGLQDFVWIPRWENSIDLSPTQVVLAGVSGAFGSNETGANSRTQIYGADFLYKWKSANSEGGFPFVKWQTEFMYRRFEAGRGISESFPVAETFHDWGLYSQVLWGFKKGWVAGIRGDYYDAEDSRFTDDLDRQSRSRISANLTWYPTEFSKIRLQYNHDFLDDTFFLAGRDVDSVFLQFEFILGAHGAHKF